MNRNRQKAFTLIELLIVVAIIPIITVALFALMNQLRLRHVQLGQRIDADEAAGRTLDRWRADVLLARAVELDADSGAMALRGTLSDGSRREIRYRLTTDGAIERSEVSPQGAVATDILCADATGLRFEQIGRGYAMRWTIECADGARRWGLDQNGYATPLFAVADLRGAAAP